MTLFSLAVFSPEKDFFEEEVEEVVFSTPEGRLGVLAGYAPTVVAVSEGVMEIRTGGEWKYAAVGQGFGEIAHNRAEFYLDTAEWADEIDAARAREALERARHRIQGNLTRNEFLRAQAATSRALARLKAVQSATSRHGD